MTDGDGTGAEGVLASALQAQTAQQTKKKAPKKLSAQQAVARLRQLVQDKLTTLEAQIGAMSAELGALETARDIGNMNTLARTLEKVIDLERKDRLARDKRRKQRRHMDDARRHALAERLEKMHAEWTPPG